MNYDASRKTAVKALISFAKGNKIADAARVLDKLDCSDKDRAFAGAVFFGCAERLVTLDFLIKPLVKKSLDKLDVPVLAILRAGLYQMLYMRVPQSAAVNESVKLAKAFGFSSATGFVNAVLRKAAVMYKAAGGEEVFNIANVKFEDEKQRVCVTYSVSEKVAEAVMQALPDDYDAFFAASFSSGEICIRVNTLATDADTLQKLLAEKTAKVRKAALPNCLYVRYNMPVSAEEYFTKGYYHVQGEASQWACANLDVHRGMKVLDICAAPGGKSATLAQEMGGGESLLCCDISGSRVELIGENMRRLGIKNVQIKQGDASVFDERLCGQDRVLCDVPCSGIGVMAQKADLRYTNGETFAALPRLQLKILRNAFRYVKKGGRLLYSTCTIRSEENADVVNAFLREEAGARVVPLKAVPSGACIVRNMMTLLPQSTGMDGLNTNSELLIPAEGGNNPTMDGLNTNSELLIPAEGGDNPTMDGFFMVVMEKM